MPAVMKLLRLISAYSHHGIRDHGVVKVFNLRIWTTLIVVLSSSITLQNALSQSSEASAEMAASDILKSFSNQEFKTIWDQKISDWARKNWSKDGFLSSMAMSRPQLGKLIDSQVITKEHATFDQATNYTGDIYAITFRNKYTTGDFYERLVVVQDSDGKYRLSGIYGSPVPSK
jgi:Protein of unknown function (DUF4019)